MKNMAKNLTYSKIISIWLGNSSEQGLACYLLLETILKTKGLPKPHGSVLVEREEEQHLLSGHCKVDGDLSHNNENLADDNQLVQFFAKVLARREDMETCGSGVDTTVGANSGPEDWNKPAQGSSPILG